MKKVKLTKAVDAFGKLLQELEFKEPTTGDAMDLGDPLIIGIDEAVSFKNDVIGKYISKLAGIPMSSVRELSMTDFLTCKTVVIGFLGGSEI